jgi:CheY-like chemotaxis protein
LAPVRRTVLVVDDDDDIRWLLEMALELTTSWKVITAHDGTEAVTMAGKHLPDAVLMDLMMPGMDGLAAFEALQADPVTRAIPVILVTAKLQVGTGRPWDGYALTGTIPKPFDPLSLGVQVADLLDWPPPVRSTPARVG